MGQRWSEAGLEGDRVQDTVRLEEERRTAKSPVIHCYGHGRQGLCRTGTVLCSRQTNGEVCEDHHFTVKYLECLDVLVYTS